MAAGAPFGSAVIGGEDLFVGRAEEPNAALKVLTGPAAAGPSTGSSMISPRRPMSSTGTTTSISMVLRMPASTTVTGRGAPSRWPPRNLAISSRGRWVADRPMRWGGRSHRSSSRSRVRARCEPRLVAARAWISSMITVSTPARVSRAAEVSMR